MTQGIIEEQENQKEKYEFLEEDDDFEEFENMHDQGMNVDMDIEKPVWG